MATKLKLKWIMNSFGQDADRYVADLCVGCPGRNIVKGAPRQTSKDSVFSLAQMDVVGLYEEEIDDDGSA